MTNTKDLRYVRTEKAIRAAFMELASTTPASSITASALCRHAEISRNAFYLHHGGVAELYATLMNELVNDVRTESFASARRRESSGTDDSFYEAIVASLARHESFLRALLPSDDGSLAKRLADGIEECYIEAALSLDEHGDSFEHRVRCAYLAWALVGFAMRWISATDRPLSDGWTIFRELYTGAVESSILSLKSGSADAH